MNLVTILDHTIDLDALPEVPVVLDVGCRDFGFARKILELRPDGVVFALDPDRNLADPNLAGCVFFREALVGDGRVSATYAGWGGGEGNYLVGDDGPPGWAEEVYPVPCVNIQSLMERLRCRWWDLVKLDCEGAEFQILENWPGPIAKQLSVEFHDWGESRKKYTDEYYHHLFTHGLRDYEVLQHRITPLGPGPAYGHWDSLFELRK